MFIWKKAVFVRRFQTRRAYRKLKSSKNKVNLNPPNGNGNLCNNCGVCMEKCPQMINIPKELEETKKTLKKQTTLLSMLK